jgi:alpha-beta hydrolase superfamily lysophospholipase
VISPIRLEVDITGIIESEGKVTTAAWLFLPPPEQRIEPPVVVFGFPGGGYSKNYYHFEVDGFAGYSMAQHLSESGFFFVACDHPGIGDSSLIAAKTLNFENITRANHATVTSITDLLVSGGTSEHVSVLATADAGIDQPRVPGVDEDPLSNAFVVGIGHSMGGCFLTIQQAKYRTFRAVGILGWTAIHCQHRHIPPSLMPEDSEIVNQSIVLDDGWTMRPRTPGLNFAHHWDDVPQQIVAANAAVAQPIPPCVSTERGGMGTPGIVSEEANVIQVPIFLAFGERDVTPDPWAEPGRYRSSTDITLTIVPGAAHCFNFASNRHMFFDRLANWARSLPRG